MGSGDRQLVARDWVELATSRHVESTPLQDGSRDADFLCGYGYQFWMSRHGYHGLGAFGQQCVVVPAHDLVVAVTSGHHPEAREQVVLDAIWDCLLPDLDSSSGANSADDAVLADRLHRLSFAPVAGSADPLRTVTGRIDASADGSALPDATDVSVDPVEGGWLVRFGSSLEIVAGLGRWRESAPLGRPVVATGGWQGSTFVAELFVITTPHRVRVEVDAVTGRAVATWNGVPITGPSLTLHLQAPLMTRPDVG